MQSIVQAHCGIAFAKFVVDPGRLTAGKVTTVPVYDIRGGLQTAKRASELASKELSGDLSKNALSLSRSAGRLLGKFKHLNASKPIPRADLEPFQDRIAELNSDFEVLVNSLRRACRASVRKPSIPKGH